MKTLKEVVTTYGEHVKNIYEAKDASDKELRQAAKEFMDFLRPKKNKPLTTKDSS